MKVTTRVGLPGTLSSSICTSQPLRSRICLIIDPRLPIIRSTCSLGTDVCCVVVLPNGIRLESSLGGSCGIPQPPPATTRPPLSRCIDISSCLGSANLPFSELPSVQELNSLKISLPHTTVPITLPPPVSSFAASSITCKLFRNSLSNKSSLQF